MEAANDADTAASTARRAELERKMARAYVRRSSTCRVCTTVLEIGRTTSARLARYSMCAGCCSSERVFHEGGWARWCSRHTHFEPIANFRVRRTSSGYLRGGFRRVASVPSRRTELRSFVRRKQTGRALRALHNREQRKTPLLLPHSKPSPHPPRLVGRGLLAVARRSSAKRLCGRYGKESTCQDWCLDSWTFLHSS